MGMFDYVHIPCAHCSADIEEQSKDGDCTLSDYTLENMPPRIAASLNGTTVWCHKCNQKTVIQAEVVCKVVMTTRKADS
jgi:hypothetical protein